MIDPVGYRLPVFGSRAIATDKAKLVRLGLAQCLCEVFHGAPTEDGKAWWWVHGETDRGGFLRIADMMIEYENTGDVVDATLAWGAPSK